jgi:FMN phosphatase YigB (HAD superfamily)
MSFIIVDSGTLKKEGRNLAIEKKSKAIICDLDGTICDDASRAHLLQEGDKDHYHAYNSQLASDEPIQEVLQLVLESKVTGREIIFLTGRNEAFRDATEVWLYLKTGMRPSQYVLRMREVGNHTPNEVFKRDVYEKELSPKYDVEWAIDDYEKVLVMWRNIGVKSFKVIDRKIHFVW